MNIETHKLFGEIVEKIDGIGLTAQGIALDFAHFVSGRVCCLSETREWIAFNGNCWDLATAQTRVEQCWDEYVSHRLGEAATLTGADLKAAMIGIPALLTAKTRNEVLQLAKPKLAISREVFDRNAEHLLVTPTGTVNLRTGELTPNDPTQHLTQCTAVAYDAEAPDPECFDGLIAKLAGDDAETADWLWRAIGYTLTGDVREDAVFYLRGPGGNGKSTLVKTLFAILGSYAAKLNIRVLTAGAEHHDTELANVRGARFVVSSEIEKGMRLRESVLKDLSGGEVQTPRDMHQAARDAARWVPTCKVWLYGNHDLVVKDTSDSIWRRLNKIESSHKFPKSGLRDSLAEKEGAGILKWAVHAAIEWYASAEGLGAQPARVKAATDAYRNEQDTLGQYFAECLVFEPGSLTAYGALTRDYTAWCNEHGYDYKVSPKELESRLTLAGCHRGRAKKSAGSSGAQGWRGVRLASARA
ncbi:MAG: phage/plasmid primase, P4 family [Pseudomonadota bacterium]